jgi:hypothetical protein
VEVIAAYDYDFAGLLSREDRYGQSYPNNRNLMHRATIWSSDPSDGGVILHEEQYRYDAHNRRTSILIDADGAGPEQGLVSPAVDG